MCNAFHHAARSTWRLLAGLLQVAARESAVVFVPHGYADCIFINISCFPWQEYLLKLHGDTVTTSRSYVELAWPDLVLRIDRPDFCCNIKQATQYQ
jgi:hypothetical protein